MELSPKQQMEQLTATLLRYNDEYYNQDNPSVPDDVYDKLLAQLRELEARYPEYAAPDSPTKRVGGSASAIFTKVQHTVQMASLQDVFSLEEIDDFDRRIRQITHSPYVVEVKIDGLSVSLEYENGGVFPGLHPGGRLCGGGRHPESPHHRRHSQATENLGGVSGSPGEVYMPKETFARLARQQEANGEAPFKNPRNAAAGSLRQKDSAVTAKRGLSIFVFNVQQSRGIAFTSHKESLDWLKEQGFAVSPRYTLCQTAQQAKEEIETIGSLRQSFPFDMDGAVVKVDNLADREIIGSTAKFPKWAVAFKYPPEEKETTLREIEISVGRTGVLTPPPSSTRCSWREPPSPVPPSTTRTTSPKRMCGWGYHCGAQKRGHYSRSGDGEVPRPGQHPLRYAGHLPLLRGTGGPGGRGSGPAVRQSLLSRHPAEKPHPLCQPGRHEHRRSGPLAHGRAGEPRAGEKPGRPLRFDQRPDSDPGADGEKSADNLLTALENSKQAGLARLLFAFGVRNIGQKGAQLICQRFSTWEELLAATQEDLASIDG